MRCELWYGLMAGTSLSHVIQSTLRELPRNNRHVRISAKSHRVSATFDGRHKGPYCIYVGPLETANKETLEALYCQARDAYYSGHPLIVDDMFDRVELRLRWYASKSVVKYPRCSIRRQSTFADAEEDLSMVFALASTWAMFLAFGSLACVGPLAYTVGMAYQNAFDSGLSIASQTHGLGFLALVNSLILIVLGFVIGHPVASASAKVLQDLWRNDLVALKGVCPNCGEGVFAFVNMDRNIDSPHRADCHICECLLEFRTKVEQHQDPNKMWEPIREFYVYGINIKDKWSFRICLQATLFHGSTNRISIVISSAIHKIFCSTRCH
ncbi:PGR5 protein 1B [Spatholobus suberectus]|nr:PGR5 protein 1B [Spatholobus suberectus]